MNSPSPDSTRDARLEGILRAYVQAVDAGQSPDRSEVLRQHPDCAVELAAFFANLDQVARLAHGMGVVYRALQMSLNRVVALKMILSARSHPHAT